MPRISASEASWWSDALEAQRRLARRGRYPVSQAELTNEIKAVRAEAQVRREAALAEQRLNRLEQDGEIDPYR